MYRKSAQDTMTPVVERKQLYAISDIERAILCKYSDRDVDSIRISFVITYVLFFMSTPTAIGVMVAGSLAIAASLVTVSMISFVMTAHSWRRLKRIEYARVLGRLSSGKK